MAAANNIVNAFLLVYARLFPIVNPIGGAPIFLGLTRHCTENERKAQLKDRVQMRPTSCLIANTYRRFRFFTYGSASAIEDFARRAGPRDWQSRRLLESAIFAGVRRLVHLRAPFLH